MSAEDRLIHPPGFRARRGRNWFLLGLMYASYYMCRYNFREAEIGMRQDFGYTISQLAMVKACWFWAYGVGQLINGLFTDRIGGKKAMLIGAFGTIAANLAFGAASFWGALPLFATIWLINGYMQAFGAPGMIKINAAWFARPERGTFAGIFGFMIQFGLISTTFAAPLVAHGFSLEWLGLDYKFAGLHWRWLFWIPTVVVALVAVAVILFVEETPAKAGYPGAGGEGELGASAESGDVRTSLAESFRVIFRHPLVWFYALAYACTGAVRHGGDQFAILYFVEKQGLSRTDNAVELTLQLMPLMAVLGSFGAGVISDRFFRGHRAPVGMTLYFLETCVILAAVVVLLWMGVKNIYWSCAFLALIALTANSTHSLVGAAAPMDIGGPKRAGFAAGVIDSFQYFGAGIAVPLIGWAIDRIGWVSWFPTMAGFGLIGGLAMLGVMRKQKQGHRD